jgi:hypothetical protein
MRRKVEFRPAPTASSSSAVSIAERFVYRPLPNASISSNANVVPLPVLRPLPQASSSSSGIIAVRPVLHIALESVSGSGATVNSHPGTGFELASSAEFNSSATFTFRTVYRPMPTSAMTSAVVARRRPITPIPITVLPVPPIRRTA